MTSFKLQGASPSETCCNKPRSRSMGSTGAPHSLNTLTMPEVEAASATLLVVLMICFSPLVL